MLNGPVAKRRRLDDDNNGDLAGTEEEAGYRHSSIMLMPDPIQTDPSYSLTWKPSFSSTQEPCRRKPAVYETPTQDHSIDNVSIGLTHNLPFAQPILLQPASALNPCSSDWWLNPHAEVLDAEVLHLDFNDHQQLEQPNKRSTAYSQQPDKEIVCFGMV